MKNTSGIRSCDWERIEVQYRAGVLSNREIAKQHAISEGVIRKKAKAGEWLRDLKPKVDARVRSELVRTTVRTETSSLEKVRTDREVVEEAAATVVEVVSRHRTDIAKLNAMVTLLQTQLLSVMEKRTLFEDAINALTANDRTTERYNKLMKAVSLQTHIVALKDLALARKNLVGLERQAFGLPDGADAVPPPKQRTDREEEEERNARLLDRLREIGKVAGNEGAA